MPHRNSIASISGGSLLGGIEAASKTFYGIDIDYVIKVIIGAAIGAIVGWIVSHVLSWCWKKIINEKKL